MVQKAKGVSGDFKTKKGHSQDLNPGPGLIHYTSRILGVYLLNKDTWLENILLIHWKNEIQINKFMIFQIVLSICKYQGTK